MGNHGSPNPSSRGNMGSLRLLRQTRLVLIFPCKKPSIPVRKTLRPKWCTLIRPEVVHFESTADRSGDSQSGITPFLLLLPCIQSVKATPAILPVPLFRDSLEQLYPRPDMGNVKGWRPWKNSRRLHPLTKDEPIICWVKGLIGSLPPQPQSGNSPPFIRLVHLQRTS